MKLSFYNTMSRELEEFKPIDAEHVRMYTCGPTVYNYAHIGNFRAYVFEDLLRRAIKINGFNLTQVMNLTDVDDKTIRDSQAQGMSLNDFTATYKKAFFEDLNTLKVEPAEHYPAATDYIPEMIVMIETLIEKGFAYKADDGSVYYSIDKFDGYGKLARIDLENQRDGVRVSNDEYDKENVADFALWKAYDKADGDVVWDSPWGKGRPGWHIECSAMSHALLGPHFDLHTGGVDNMFPHHDDEIAQSEACHGCKFVNYWLHCAHLQINGAKMSKSLNNFYTLPQLLEKGYTGEEVRFALLATHYRSGLNFIIESDVKERESLVNARAAIGRINGFIARVLESEDKGSDSSDLAEKAEKSFLHNINNDLNISGALASVFDFIREINKLMDEKGGCDRERVLAAMKYFDRILNVMQFELVDDTPAEIVALMNERLEVRKAKDWARADEIRDTLKEQGWVVEDTPAGPKAKRI